MLGLLTPAFLCNGLTPRGSLLLCLVLFAFSGALQAHGDGRLEIARLTTQIAQNRKDARLYLERAILYRNHGLYRAAHKDLEQAATLQPGLAGLALESSPNTGGVCLPFSRQPPPRNKI